MEAVLVLPSPNQLCPAVLHACPTQAVPTSPVPTPGLSCPQQQPSSPQPPRPPMPQLTERQQQDGRATRTQPCPWRLPQHLLGRCFWGAPSASGLCFARSWGRCHRGLQCSWDLSCGLAGAASAWPPDRSSFQWGPASAPATSAALVEPPLLFLSSHTPQYALFLLLSQGQHPPAKPSCSFSQHCSLLCPLLTTSLNFSPIST